MNKILICLLLISCSLAQANNDPSFDTCTDKFRQVIRSHTDLDSTLKAWDAAKSFCPQDGAFEQYTTAIYSGFGKDNEGTEYIKQQAAKYKKTPRRILYALSEAYNLEGDVTKSVEVAKRLIRDHPNWYGGYRLLGIYTSHEGDHRKSREYFEIAINDKEDGRNAMNYMSLVKQNYLLQDYIKAALSFYKAEQLHFETAIMSRQLSCYGCISYIKCKEYANAKIALTRQAKYDPECVNLPIYKEAVRLYEEATGEKL